MIASLPLAFFLSGAASLIFQVVWFHKAGLALDYALWAVTSVLSSFMAGLATGDFLPAGTRPSGEPKPQEPT